MNTSALMVASILAAAIALPSASWAEGSKRDAALTAKYCQRVLKAKGRELEGQPLRIEYGNCLAQFPNYY